ncbi:unnamed protein product [Rotaria sp. Silwood1]|nr:unnamed protein product [Rotaria sp. Silwood1]CAF4927156.1 unnamed protein product [Rotaria sp. Silwood1]CAF4962708.1 unnamed protein product [Rotaria sp. Silwood1]
MLLFLYCSKSKQFIAKKHSIIAIPIGFFFLGSLILFLFGAEQFHKSCGFITGQCQVTSIDLRKLQRNYRLQWNITVLYNNQSNNDVIISSNNFSPESLAWFFARKYKINEAYLCYHSPYSKSYGGWGWQWDKPMKWKAYTYLSSALEHLLLLLYFLN